MRLKTTYSILLIALICSCSTEQENNTNNLQQDIEENVLDMLFQTDRPSCSDEEYAIMEAADTGNYEVVMQYLKNGGDPMLECEDKHSSPLGYLGDYLSIYMKSCDSMEYVKYYLSLDITQDVKNDFFFSYLILENYEMTTYLVDIGGRFPNTMYCFPDALPRFKKAAELGYDLDWQDPETGNSLFMNYAWCESEKDTDGNIEVLKYLVSQAVQKDLKNNEGKTAIDLATNEKIKAYLQGLE
ncbi:MAG: ankyrin repeat protein [Crocinitomix sp.]|jgi:ankyrin repeat protein